MVITTKWRNFPFLCKQQQKQGFICSSISLRKYPDVIYVNDLHRSAQSHWTTATEPPSLKHVHDIDDIGICAYIFPFWFWFIQRNRNKNLCVCKGHINEQTGLKRNKLRKNMKNLQLAQNDEMHIGVLQ